MWRINCGECGKTSIADQWLETAMGPLPAGHLQCPECKAGIKKNMPAINLSVLLGEPQPDFTTTGDRPRFHYFKWK